MFNVQRLLSINRVILLSVSLDRLGASHVITDFELQVESFVRTALDLYAFIAITASLSPDATAQDGLYMTWYVFLDMFNYNMNDSKFGKGVSPTATF